jgi:filamentous hemagglutinin family protein
VENNKLDNHFLVNIICFSVLVSMDSVGDLYFSELLSSPNGRVRKISVSTGIVSTIIGTGATGGGAAYTLNNPNGIWINSVDTLYVSDTFNARVLSYSVSTTTTTVLISSGLSLPASLWGDTLGNLYIPGYYCIAAFYCQIQ